MNKKDIDNLFFRIQVCCESVNWQNGKEFVVIDFEALRHDLEKWPLGEEDELRTTIEEFWICNNCSHMIRWKSNPNKSRDQVSQCTRCQTVAEWLTLVSVLKGAKLQ